MEKQKGPGGGTRVTGRRVARCLSVVILASTASLLSDGAAADEGDIELLLEGVAEIGAPGAPGPMCVYGPDAFPVVVGATGETRAPVVTAARWESGRVVALGHGAYFERATIDTGDSGRLLENALHWAAGTGSARVGVVTGGAADQLLDWLLEAGFDAAETPLTAESLADVGVVAVELWEQGDAELEALSDFVRDGGGVVAVATAWAWAIYEHPELDLVEDFPGNRLLAAAGVQWADDQYPARTSSAGYAAEGSPDPYTHALAALDGAEAHAAGSLTLTQPEIDQAAATLDRTVRCLPPGDTLLAPRLRALVQSDERRWPTENEPVGTDDIVDRLAGVFYVTEHKRTAPRSVRAHPAAADFPGVVPEDAARVTRWVAVDTSRPRWHSTGLYAAPGELVMVNVPEAAAASGALHVRVGAHTDHLYRHSEWKRMPEISRRFPVSATRTPVANAFGGLIYVEVEPGVDFGTVTVEIEGAVTAPRFVLGETDADDWRAEIRDAPAPWAEIEGRNMIVTTDAREVRHLDDPASVAEVWDRVLDLSAELAAWNAPRASPERFVVDRQISVGYMHDGYPLMAHMDQAAHFVDATFLRSCQKDWRGSIWGMYHEVGHNHQSDHWTFDGTGEVTVNLFTLYVHEFLCGIGVADAGWPEPGGLTSPGDLQLRRQDFEKQHLARWESEPSLGLLMYAQLLQEFGWEPFRRVFREYLDLPVDELPANDDEKRDQWLTRFSRTVGRNLAPFLDAWGVSTSRAAEEEVSDLPVWLPAASGFPIRPVAGLGDLDDDGKDDVLVRHFNGRWYYYPMNGRRNIAAGRGTADLPVESTWSFAGIGDFDSIPGDEVLLRHENGRWQQHPMVGRRQRAEPEELALPRSLDWRLAAVGDFDGDGSDDVLLRHVRGHWRFQPIRGGVAMRDGAGGARIPGSLDFRLEGVGDFDGDGKDDVLLRHVEGRWFYYPMDGRDNAGPRVATDLPADRKWRLAGIGDFDDDGHDDVLLRHWEDHSWRYYRSADNKQAGSGIANLTRNPLYGVAAIGDLDGDGKADVLLRRNDGVWYYYGMDGRRVKDRGGASLTRNLVWQVARN